MKKPDIRQPSTANKILYCIPLIIVGLCVFVSLIHQHFVRDKLTNEGVKTTGKIIEMKRGSRIRDPRHFRYAFLDASNKVIFGEEIKNLPLDSLLMKRSFLVIYDKDDPATSTILVSRENYEYFSLAFPDSLRWIDDLQNR